MWLYCSWSGLKATQVAVIDRFSMQKSPTRAHCMGRTSHRGPLSLPSWLAGWWNAMLNIGSTSHWQALFMRARLDAYSQVLTSWISNEYSLDLMNINEAEGSWMLIEEWVCCRMAMLVWRVHGLGLRAIVDRHWLDYVIKVCLSLWGRFVCRCGVDTWKESSEGNRSGCIGWQWIRIT